MAIIPLYDHHSAGMNEFRKQPSASFWATVLLAVLVLYPLSFGPACWIASYGHVDADDLRFVYRPLALFSLGRYGWPSLWVPFLKYGALFGKSEVDCVTVIRSLALSDEWAEALRWNTRHSR